MPETGAAVVVPKSLFETAEGSKVLTTMSPTTVASELCVAAVPAT